MKYLIILILGLVIASFFIVIDIQHDAEEKHLEIVREFQDEAKQRVLEHEEELRKNKLILLYELNYHKTGDFQYKQIADYIRGI